MLLRNRIIALILIIVGVGLGYFDYSTQSEDSRFNFKLGLDLKGGTHLIYTTDVSNIAENDISDSLEALRDVIERRVNIFGVSEPKVQVEKNKGDDGEISGRLIVELPGVTDVDEAINLIGATPVLEFRIENPSLDMSLVEYDEETGEIKDGDGNLITIDDIYIPSGLTGQHLKRAQLQFNNVTSEPIVTLDFDGEGKDLFAEITKNNVGKTVAIYLDGVPIQTPVVREEITGGQAQISGGYTIEEAKLLAGRMSAGALPIPISLLSTQTIGASLGEEAVASGVVAGMYGLILVSLFFILWYRLPGLLAVGSLGFYMVTMFALFKLIPVTLTAPGIAGFILSIGLAVDANVLIFERLKEELALGRGIEEAITNAFGRAWPSIRDGNLSSFITAVILFWFGTSLIKGFALTFGIGVLISMFSAIVLTRALLISLGLKKKVMLLSSGVNK